MKEGKESKSAVLVASFRAAESSRPEHERVCYDPFAGEFIIGKNGILGMIPVLGRIALWLFERMLPGIIGEVVVRTRYIDDYLKTCINDGIQQLVILGAGYDSRAYRIEGLKGKVKVFEVDNPATQRAKIEELKKLFESLPDHIVYVPINFGKDKLDQRLFASGYQENLKTLFIWEGVTMYLTAEAVDDTLAFVVDNSGRDSSIIFNYIHQSVVDGTSELKVARRNRNLAARHGEAFTFGIEEGTIEDFLSKRGFHQINNASPGFLERTYFIGANQGRKVCPYQPTVHAIVKS
jgi:methyltransferase (TIGR00027 family)